ncbi:unnamed protein product [Timema podura]|uniref:Ribosomal protein L20 n=1 Tax=Timema podura TaxID=61482 RepID=A0ABN7P401_TIMPD|nr:unnamed protein product [Timema podura]
MERAFTRHRRWFSNSKQRLLNNIYLSSRNRA